MKTHTAWTYTVLEPGSFLWTSPHGHTYLRDHTGTIDLTPEQGPSSRRTARHPARPDDLARADPDPPDQ